MEEKKEAVIETLEKMLSEGYGSSVNSLSDFKCLLTDLLKEKAADELTYRMNGKEICIIQNDLTVKESNLFGDIVILDNQDFTYGNDFEFNEIVVHTLVTKLLFVESGEIKVKIEMIFNEACKFFDSLNYMLGALILCDLDKVNIIKDTDLLMLRRSLHRRYQNIEDFRLSIMVFNPNAKEPGYIDIT